MYRDIVGDPKPEGGVPYICDPRPRKVEPELKNPETRGGRPRNFDP